MFLQQVLRLLGLSQEALQLLERLVAPAGDRSLERVFQRGDELVERVTESARCKRGE